MVDGAGGRAARRRAGGPTARIMWRAQLDHHAHLGHQSPGSRRGPGSRGAGGASAPAPRSRRARRWRAARSAGRRARSRRARWRRAGRPPAPAARARRSPAPGRRRRPAPPRPADLADSTASSARRSSSAASGASSPPSASTAPIERVGMDVEAGDAQRLLHGRAQQLGRLGDLGRRASTANSSSPIAGQQRLLREGGGQARAQRRQHEVGALVAQRFVQPAQAIEVGDHQARSRRPACSCSRARPTKLRRSSRPVRRIAARRRRSAVSRHDDAGGAQRRPPARRRARGRARRRACARARRSRRRARGLEDVLDRRRGPAAAPARAPRRTEHSGASGARPSAARCAGQPQAVGARDPTPTAPTSAAPRASRARVASQKAVVAPSAPSADGTLRTRAPAARLRPARPRLCARWRRRRHQSEQQMISPDHR